jgi:large subunit ribosomal protein L22
VRLIADLIRGRDVNDALSILKFSPQRAASMMTKVLKSAIANADSDEADVESLFIQSATVNEGPTMHRFQPKDRGRAHPIAKRTSHITVVVAAEE